MVSHSAVAASLSDSSIMAVRGGPRDVVALSVGSREGVDNGTVFSLWRMGSHKVDRVKYERTDELVLRATHGTSVATATKVPRMRRGEGITGAAAAARTSVASGGVVVALAAARGA